ncbi:hypothetical protein V6Z11_D13G113900 [Gossypium hirsutum]
MSSCRSVARGICKILAASAVEKVHCWICSILILFPILTIRKRRRDNWNTIPGIGYRNLTLSVVVATGETICSPVAGTAGMTIDAMTPWLTEKTAAKEKNSIKVLAEVEEDSYCNYGEGPRTTNGHCTDEVGLCDGIFGYFPCLLRELNEIQQYEVMN